MSNEPINLDDGTLDAFRALGGAEDDARWQFGALLSQNVDAYKEEVGGKVKPAVIRANTARMRQQAASAAGIDRSAASDRENVSRFYAGTESEYPTFSWSQFRALKSAKSQWRELADLVQIQSQKFGGVMATPAVIRIFSKALKGELLTTLVQRLEAVQEAAGAELTPKDISDVWKSLGVSDIPDWQEALGRLRDNSDAIYRMDDLPQKVKDLLSEFGNNLSDVLNSMEKGDDSTTTNPIGH